MPSRLQQVQCHLLIAAMTAVLTALHVCDWPGTLLDGLKIWPRSVDPQAAHRPACHVAQSMYKAVSHQGQGTKRRGADRRPDRAPMKVSWLCRVCHDGGIVSDRSSSPNLQIPDGQWGHPDAHS